MSSDVTPSEAMDTQGLILPAPGSRLSSAHGEYLLEKVVGRGGMGMVYKASTPEGDPCAVKVLTPEVTSDPGFLERLQRELALGPKLNHPHIVDSWDAGHDRGLIFLVMPFVEGRNLKEVLSDAPLAPEEMIRLLRPVAEALDFAHETGVVHCDLKPQNILVQNDPRLAFISDFGLVRPAGRESTASRSREVFGSVQYMAPEQIEGHPVDGRTDVYGLACTIFETLTGRIPFERPNEVAVLWAHVNDPLPRVTALNRRLPGGLDEALAKGMAKHPDDRYLTCGELLSAVEAALSKSLTAALLPPVRPLVERRRRLRTEREVWSPNFFPELARVRAASENRRWDRLAPIVAAMSIALAATTQVVHPQGLSGAAADVESLARAGGERLGDLITLEDPQEPKKESPSLTADAAARTSTGVPRPPHAPTKDLFVGAGGSAKRPTGASGSREESLETNPSEANPPGALSQPATERSGIVYISDTCVPVTYPGTECDTEIFAVAVDGKEPRRLTSTQTGVEEFPVLSPDGTEIAFNRWDMIDGDAGQWLMDADGSDARMISSPVDGWDETFSWSPEGDIAFTRWPQTHASERDSHGDVLLVSRTGEMWTEEPLLTRPGTEKSPAFSPNGRRIAYSFDPDDDGFYSPGESEQSDIWVSRSDGTGHKRMTRSHRLIESHPTWSPDGERIAYARGTNDAYWKMRGRAEIWVMRADGSGKRRLTPRGYLDLYPAWSPGGKRITFTRCSSEGAFDCGIAVIEVAHPGRVEIIVDAKGYLEAQPSWLPSVGS